ncbi:hypothetical protein VOLCADRAFT_44344, partial [Volvox carteri f. nagariensis]
LFAGGAAGAIAKTCVAPLERTKILLMVRTAVRIMDFQSPNLASTLRLILATEGVPGLFRGNGASCLRIMPYAAIHFSVYEAYRRILAEHMIASRRRRPGPIVDLVAGSAAGATAVLLTYPLDMVRTRMAWAMDGGNASTAAVPEAHGLAAAARQPPAHHIRIGAMLVHTARHEGIRGLYRGLAPTLYGIMPYAGLKFFVYGSLKQCVSERLPVPYMLAFGGVSGLLAQTVTYPLDVVRRRMQVYGIQQEAAASAVTSRLTTWDVGSTIVRQEGLRGLFRGLSLNYVKVVPSTAIGFTVYDMFKSYLGV